MKTEAKAAPLSFDGSEQIFTQFFPPKRIFLVETLRTQKSRQTIVWHLLFGTCYLKWQWKQNWI
jgi:hypothetical protein